MELRPELMPPKLDEAKVARLARLADRIDGAAPGQCDALIDEFNRVAATKLAFAEFQGIYGAEEHDTWVRRLLIRQTLEPTPDVARDELVEIVRRAMAHDRHPENEAYMAIFDANVPLPSASNLIFYPLDGGTEDNEGDYNPTPEQIVEWSLSEKREPGWWLRAEK